jgi:hypothetical protein
MRALAISVAFLTIAIHPVCAGEAFIAQLANKTAAAGPAAVNARTTPSAATTAVPVKLNVANAVNVPTATPGTNTSGLIQIGSNNSAAITQTGGGNASAVVQHGSGNQAVVTQRR